MSPTIGSVAQPMLVLTLMSFVSTKFYYMARLCGQARGTESCAGWLLPERALAYSLEITRCVPQENNVLFPYYKSFIDQACSVKMAGYWPSSSLTYQYPVILTSRLVHNPYTIWKKSIYSSNSPQVFMVYRLINHAGCW